MLTSLRGSDVNQMGLIHIKYSFNIQRLSVTFIKSLQAADSIFTVTAMKYIKVKYGKTQESTGEKLSHHYGGV